MAWLVRPGAAGTESAAAFGHQLVPPHPTVRRSGGRTEGRRHGGAAEHVRIGATYPATLLAWRCPGTGGHDYWTTTEAALTEPLSDDLREAWERLRECAAELTTHLRLRQLHHVRAQDLLRLRPAQAKVHRTVPFPRPCRESATGPPRRTALDHQDRAPRPHYSPRRSRSAPHQLATGGLRAAGRASGHVGTSGSTGEDGAVRQGAEDESADHHRDQEGAGDHVRHPRRSAPTASSPCGHAATEPLTGASTCTR